jgi:hypothetical protein
MVLDVGYSGYAAGSNFVIATPLCGCVTVWLRRYAAMPLCEKMGELPY